MGFLSPWFLAGLAGVALPLYVHLLKQHRSEPVRFSSTMFLERRTQSSIKHRRLMYLALLAMRLLIIILLSLLFANPFLRRGQAAGAEGRKLVVVAIDNSFSMRAGDRFERAKRRAGEVLASLKPGDKGQVMAFASSVQMLTQPTSDPGELRRAVAALQPGDGRSAYAEIARILRAMGQPEGLPVEAHVITDAQRTSMPAPFSELAVAPAQRLKVHSVVDKAEANWFVEAVSVPRSVFQPKKVRVQATVAAAGAEPGEVAVELVLNGRTIETRRVNIPASGRAMVEFFLPDASYGFNRGEVRVVKGDTLPQDDRFPFALERKEASKVLFVYEPRSARSVSYFRAALEAVEDAGFTVEPVGVEQASNMGYDKYAAVVLSDAFIEGPLADWVKSGGGVMVAVGPSLAARGRVPLTGAAIREGRYASREGERFLAVGQVDATHPAVARAGNFEPVKFYRTYDVDTDNSRVAARLSDGAPLLVEQRLGAGRVLVFSSTLDNISNDLPVHSSFVPFAEQSVEYLAGVEASPSQYVVDSFVELRAARDARAAVDILDPDGRRALTLKEAADAQAFRLTREGYYELRRGNGRNELIAVHADRRESDLDVVSAETLALWQGGGGGSGGAPGTADDGAQRYSLWWYFALALLIASVVESLFSSRYLEAAPEQSATRRKAAA